jgi:hypothetical protein
MTFPKSAPEMRFLRFSSARVYSESAKLEMLCVGDMIEESQPTKWQDRELKGRDFTQEGWTRLGPRVFPMGRCKDGGLPIIFWTFWRGCFDCLFYCGCVFCLFSLWLPSLLGASLLCNSFWIGTFERCILVREEHGCTIRRKTC